MPRCGGWTMENSATGNPVSDLQGPITDTNWVRSNLRGRPWQQKGSVTRHLSRPVAPFPPEESPYAGRPPTSAVKLRRSSISILQLASFCCNDSLTPLLWPTGKRTNSYRWFSAWLQCTVVGNCQTYATLAFWDSIYTNCVCVCV